MLQCRVIPCLLLHKGGLVKTVQFKKPKYIGDPINAVKIFNEKEVDEIMVIDIDATVEKREPRYELIEEIVSEAFMPVCYGGGITTVKQMQQLFRIGVEKISISSAAMNCPDLVSRAARQFGNQSIIVTLDVKRSFFKRKYQVVTLNSLKRTGADPVKTAEKMASLGAGELVINNVDRDGTMEGYDISLLKQITNSVNIPVISLGGAGTIEHLRSAIIDGGASAVAAGSMFVFHGRHKGVLINYPAHDKIQQFIGTKVHE